MRRDGCEEIEMKEIDEGRQDLKLECGTAVLAGSVRVLFQTRWLVSRMFRRTCTTDILSTFLFLFDKVVLLTELPDGHAGVVDEGNERRE